MQHWALGCPVGFLLATAALALGCEPTPADPATTAGAATQASSEEPARPSSVPSAASSVTYAVCRGNLASLEILPPRHAGGAYAIAAQLDPDATAEVERLTRARLGASLAITLGERTFVAGPIRAPVRSGLFVNASFPSRDQAEHWLQVFRSELPDEPCGGEA